MKKILENFHTITFTKGQLEELERKEKKLEEREKKVDIILKNIERMFILLKQKHIYVKGNVESFHINPLKEINVSQEHNRLDILFKTE